MGDNQRERVRRVWKASPVAFAAAIGVMAGGLGLGAVQVVGASTSSGDRAIFEPLDPVRILDTRTGLGATGGSTAPVGAGGVIDLQVTGAGGVPIDATAVVMNVTYTEPTAPSYLTIWPTGTERPVASNLNMVPGASQPNLVTVKLGTDGRVSIYNYAGTTHVLADVAGYYRGHDFDDRYYTKAEVDAFLSAVTGANVADGSLSLSDLGSIDYPDEFTETVASPITLPAGTCKAALTANYGSGVVGKMVVGVLTDSNGGAVLPNTAAVIPSIVIPTTQGGAVPNVVVCNTGGGSLTVPAGSVFRWRLIDA